MFRHDPSSLVWGGDWLASFFLPLRFQVSSVHVTEPCLLLYIETLWFAWLIDVPEKRQHGSVLSSKLATPPPSTHR